jgi:aminopeptidase N
MAPGRHVLVLDYDASLVDNGLFRSRVAGDWYAWSAFEPAGARTAFPSFDEPRFKTPFTARSEAPSSDLVIANARKREAKARPPPRATSSPRQRPSDYLVQIAVGPSATGSTVAAPTPWRRRPRPSAPLRPVTKDRPAFALANMGPIERLIEASGVGQPYPFAKLDAIATPEWSGSALEDAGAILFADDVFLGSGEIDPAFVSRFAADVPTKSAINGSVIWSRRAGGTISGSTKVRQLALAWSSPGNGGPASRSAATTPASPSPP